MLAKCYWLINYLNELNVKPEGMLKAWYYSKSVPWQPTADLAFFARSRSLNIYTTTYKYWDFTTISAQKLHFCTNLIPVITCRIVCIYTGQTETPLMWQIYFPKYMYLQKKFRYESAIQWSFDSTKLVHVYLLCSWDKCMPHHQLILPN